MEPIEEIWQTVSKPGPDGKRYILLKGMQDLGFLYISGFVDIKKYNFQEWINAFASSRQKDGSYLISHDQWVEKKKFRYSGPVGVPFDPMTIKEEEYSEQEFIELLKTKVIPNTIFDQSAIPRIVAEFKLQKKIQNGKIGVDKALKKMILDTVNDHPSPLRVLQVMVDTMRRKKGLGKSFSQFDLQKSQFSAGRTAQEIAKARLAEIAREIQRAETPVPEGPTVSLKDLGRKRRTTGRI